MLHHRDLRFDFMGGDFAADVQTPGEESDELLVHLVQLPAEFGELFHA
jgi:hypothetical protein